MYCDTFSQFPTRVSVNMLPKLILATLVLCAVLVVITGDRGYCKKCYFIPNRRMKRGKYYSSPPQRFYSRPPVSFPHIGAYSYTPPPNYMAEDDSPYPGPPGSRPYKVSRRPNDGLGDEDINNLMKYLTKQDLDKIVDFASSQKQNEPFGNSNDFDKNTKLSVYKVQSDNEILGKNLESEERKQEANNLFKANVQYITPEGPSPLKEYKYTENVNFMTESIQQNTNTDLYKYNPMQTEPRIVNKPISYDARDTEQYNTETQNEANFSEEDYMPKPLNLREESDFYGAFTNNVPKVVPSDMYKVESFGELPLMDYNSKLDSVSSYLVPHYTVTTSSKQGDSSSALLSSSSSAKGPAVEPAPPASAGKEQSDAHLKATKIWSHKSKGAAYYLHDDGTLSLEKPGPPKRSYSHS